MNSDASSPPEPTVLQSWDAYVDAIHDGKIELVMSDTTTDQGEEREIGIFPASMLEHLAPRQGQLVTVEVLSDRNVRILNTVLSDEQKARNEARVEELLDLLKRLQED